MAEGAKDAAINGFDSPRNPGRRSCAAAGGAIARNRRRPAGHTGKEPIPHDEILAVTAIVHAATKSIKEKSRLVELREVSGA